MSSNRTNGWGLPVVFVPEKDGTVQCCVYYRELNAVAAKDSYSLPQNERRYWLSWRCEDVFHTLTRIAANDRLKCIKETMGRPHSPYIMACTNLQKWASDCYDLSRYGRSFVQSQVAICPGILKKPRHVRKNNRNAHQRDRNGFRLLSIAPNLKK